MANSGFKAVIVQATSLMPLLILLCSYVSIAQQRSSVLAQGTWFKIAITQSGIYKIDANTLKNIGFDTRNPQNIKIFGNGGKLLPQANHTNTNDDLIENAIELVGEQDGNFDTNDYILFYGESPHQIVYDSSAKAFSHQINYYSDTTYYFLTNSEGKGLRIQQKSALVNTKIEQIIDTFDEVYFHEIDQKNMVSSGREWYGEYFGVQASYSFSLPLDSLLGNVPVRVRTSAIAAATQAATLTCSINQRVVATQKLQTIGVGRYDLKGIESQFEFATNASSPLEIKYDYVQNTGGVGGAYLNYFEVLAKRKLVTFQQQTHFRSLESLTSLAVEYRLTKTNEVRIWDISQALKPLEQASVSDNKFVFFQTEPHQKLSTYLMFTTSNLMKIAAIQAINNQNIHAAPLPDLLIITAKKWQNEAERLANFRKQHDALETWVVSNEEIYNEFASGIADPASIRNYIRYLWKQNPEKLKYVLLFGDASFDYKNHLKLNSTILQDLIPSYESRESLHPINSFSSDDYFGFLEDTEGEWQENHGGNHTLDIGLGRLPVKTLAEASLVVDKLIYYAIAKKTIGKWRTQLSFVADDGDGNIHQEDAEQLAEMASELNGNLRLNKIYLDAYPQILQADGARIPEANKALETAVNKGSLIINYNGHGGVEGWAEEKLLTDQNLLSWRNLNNMPLFLTATCEFGRYDNPNVVSGAELAVLSPKGLAIALLTTTRPVYANTNFLLNNAFYQAAMKQPNETLGNLMKFTKNNSFSGVINRNFSLLGDPSMKLSYPQQKIVLRRINNKEPKNEVLKALSKVKIEGEVLGAEYFSGKVYVSVYDKASLVSTLGTKADKMNYKSYKNKLYEGVANINKGLFELNFIVPKDIDYRLGKGKMYFYAINADSTLDAVGSFQDFLVGGSETITETDNTPPAITLHIDENKQLVAEVSDENGINIASNGIGHEMLLTINDTLKIPVNQYYNSGEDFRKGTLHYDLSFLPAGNYTVRLKIWDIYNNVNIAALNFIVQEPIFQILELGAYPNPFNTSTIFRIKHNRIDDDLYFKLNIYDSKGELIDTKEEYCYLCPEVYEFGYITEQKKWFRGIYFYRIFVNSLNKTAESSGSGKLMFWK